MIRLVEQWREEAAILRRRGATNQAETLESCAADLQAFARERALEALTLREAAHESGYSYSRLEQLVRDGTIPNAGHAQRPRIRRCDLPRKPGQRPPLTGDGIPDLAGAILAGHQ